MPLRTRTAVGALAVAATMLAASACGGSGAARAIPSGKVALSVRQVYETNAPGNGPPATIVTDTSGLPPGPPPSPAASPAAYAMPRTDATTPTDMGMPGTEPSAAEIAAYANLDCSDPANQQPASVRDEPEKFLVTCGAPDQSNVPGAKKVWYRYLLYPTLIAGREVASASAQDDTQFSGGWGVLLTFTSGAANTWTKFTASHVGTLTAIVLDGDVFSAETIQGAITGPTQITGNFTKAQATALAQALQKGAAAR